MAVISIVVPVYNVEMYVGKCLDSLTNQTFSDIEIICVDDASIDRSLEIVKNKAKEDSRIKVICHTENMGTLRARKHGVEYAASRYMMFVDSDDWLEPEACQKLYDVMEREQVDILQFGTNVIPAVPLSADLVSWVEHFLKPFEQRLEGRLILESCFGKDKFDFNITDKIWRTNLCKKAFEKVENIKLIASEDRYVFFILAYYAKSYLGIGDSHYYNYNVGIGVTGSDELDLARFEKRCTGVTAAKSVKHFLENEGVFEEYQELYERFGNLILWDCVDCWYNKLPHNLQGAGYDILLRYWPTEEVVSAIARMYFESEDSIQERTASSSVFSETKCIGIYYRYLGFEPITDSIKSRINLEKKSGNQIYIFTDQDAPICAQTVNGAKIIRLPNSKDANWDHYKERAVALQIELENHKISRMLYASPTSHIAWLDMLLIRSLKIAAVFLDENRELSYSNVTELKNNKIELEQKIRELQSQQEHLLHSRSFRIGAAITWFPRKIRLFIKNIKG